MAASRGLFFVFEGLDRSGKSTQSERLYKLLLEKNVVAKKMQFPNRGTTIGGLINSYVSFSRLFVASCDCRTDMAQKEKFRVSFDTPKQDFRLS